MFLSARKKTFSVLLSCLSLGLYAQGIAFQTLDLEQALVMAKEQNKYIFVDIYATWCGPCKWMDKNVFKHESLNPLYQDKFIALKIDGEKGQGPKLVEQFQVPGYPTMIFLSPQGEEVYRLVGARPLDEFLAESNKALDPANQLHKLRERFEKGERDPSFLRDYMTTLLSAGDQLSLKKVSETYWAAQSKEQYTNPEHFNLVLRTVHDYHSPVFQAYVAQRKTLNSLPKDELNFYFNYVVHIYIESIVETGSSLELDKASKQLKADWGKESAKYIADLKHHFYMGDSKQGFKHTKYYLDNYADDPEELNSIAWFYYENETDVKRLKAALSWTNRALKQSDAWHILDTKAHLLFALDRKAEAKQAAEQAIKQAEALGQDPQDTRKLLERLQQS